MSQPMSSSNNQNLIHTDENRTKEQAQHGYVSGAEQMTVEERELQRNATSNALENAGDPRLTEERVIPEGMGGAGGGDVTDVGDVGYPEEAGGGRVARQMQDQPEQGQGTVRLEGMGGAGGGDIDDVGDVGYPEGTITSVEPADGPPAADADERFQAWAMAGGTGGDVETRRRRPASAPRAQRVIAVIRSPNQRI